MLQTEQLESIGTSSFFAWCLIENNTLVFGLKIKEESVSRVDPGSRCTGTAFLTEMGSNGEVLASICIWTAGEPSPGRGTDDVSPENQLLVFANVSGQFAQSLVAAQYTVLTESEDDDYR